MNNTNIDWTDLSWNPVTGCSHSGTPECDNCYARSIALQKQLEGSRKYRDGFKVALHPEEFQDILPKQSNKLVFIASMSDLFHENVPDKFIDEVMNICEFKKNFTFQVLTKRAERMASYFHNRLVPSNVWIGVTCGHEKSLFRLSYLKQIDAPVRWISSEPLLGDIAPHMDLTGIDWVVVGGEKDYYHARPMKEEWAWHMKEACDKAGAAFFFKQWGTWDKNGRRCTDETENMLLKGERYRAFPKCWSNNEDRTYSLF